MYKYLFFCVLAIVFFLPEYYLPILEKKLGWQAQILGGETGRKIKPIFFPKKWLSGKYQKQYTSALKDQSPVRDLLVRTRNQLEYSTLNTIGNQQVIPGKEGVLYSKSYIDAARGIDFKGEQWIQQKASKLKIIINYFKNKGIPLVVVTPPGKPRIYPQHLPQVYQNESTSPTNRGLFLKTFKELNIPLIDFTFFKAYEAKTGNPVYPQFGLHWNYLGAAIAADTISAYCSKQGDFSFPDRIGVDSIPFSTHFKPTDTELLRSANLLSQIEAQPMPYPIVQYTNLADSLKPKAIVIGDSYYQILLKEGYHEALFQSDSPFWFYFKTEAFKQAAAYHGFKRDGKGIMDRLAAADMILLSCSETNLAKFGFGFIDLVYEQIEEIKE